jgi:dTDP-4-dehydrorhamnose 3,5-epimerase
MNMPFIEDFELIVGVKTVVLEQLSDDRGLFLELFRKEWFPERTWDILQSNRSVSSPGVLRGLHYHHRQVDYWHLSDGAIRVGLLDLRPLSPTYLQACIIDLNASEPRGLFIPVGVAHGFYTFSRSSLFYIVDNYYDGDDEFGVAWNDPEINLDWGVKSPIVSPRDHNNPLLHEIPEADYPEPLKL